MESVNPGDILACKYRVERVLGSGGMGVVVAARHKQLGQLVAIKLLHQGLGTAEGSEATARFMREAKAAAMLKSEHIARVYDVDTLDTGQPFIVMEYLEGTDLAELSTQRGRLPVSESVAYLVQACEGLAEAHACGIIHRDIKPANLFITRTTKKAQTGQTKKAAKIVKVLDFGVSKMTLLSEGEHDITRTSAMLGSPRFMSPEQLHDARTVDARSDVWSLGVVLYRLVSGRPPFDGKTLGAVVASILHDKPAPLSGALKNLPPGFEPIVLRCLEKDPANRFSSVVDLANALMPYADGAAAGKGAVALAAQTARRTSRPWLALGAIGAFAAAAGVASAMHFFSGWTQHSRSAVEIRDMPPSIVSAAAPIDTSVAPSSTPSSTQGPPAPKVAASVVIKPARPARAHAPAAASRAASSDSADNEMPSTRE
ncbi:MAG: serine/threonine protein kinase [Polyangiaceae bacterium]|nr:serine/threonine protein kinase [Polyangiaceae bacterium]